MDSITPPTERHSAFNSSMVKLYLLQNDLPTAKEYFEQRPYVAFEVAAQLVFSFFEDTVQKNNEERIQEYKKFISLFKNYHEEPDVQKLLEQIALALLAGPNVTINDKLAQHQIDRLIPCSCVQEVMKGIIETVKDALIKEQLRLIYNNLHRLTAKEIHLLLSSSWLEQPFTKKYASINIMTYETLTGQESTAAEIATYTLHTEQDLHNRCRPRKVEDRGL